MKSISCRTSKRITRWKLRHKGKIFFRVENFETKQIKWQYENYTNVSESKFNKLEKQWQKEILI